MDETIQKTMNALKANGMVAYYAENKADAVRLALSLIPNGASVAVGGSVTLSELGMLESLRNGDYIFHDRYAAKTPEERFSKFREGLTCDFFLCSSNAVTENGDLYNVDGTCNRIGAITFGPENVIVIVGRNKLVPTLNDAILRVKTVAAPLNCKRLNRETYCSNTGKCMSITEGKGTVMTAGCNSPERICSTYTVCGWQNIRNRIKVIIVNEDLGY